MIQDQLTARGIRDPRVLEAMGRVPRQEFVDPGLASQAYLDHPLSIGMKQTISQPYMAALMTEALELSGNEKVLEIGTGSGYQTAILAELSQKVFSIERLTALSNRARRILYHLGYVNVTLRIGDGTVGWPEEAPFDAILVTSAGPQIPPPYIEQLAKGGRLVVPRGSENQQELVRVRKVRNRMTEEVLSDCRFVKLVGTFGWGSE